MEEPSEVDESTRERDAANGIVRLTKEEAIAAVHRCAFTETVYDDDDQPTDEPGRTIVHSFIIGAFALGADWDAASVIELIERSDKVAYVPTMFGTCLNVIGEYEAGSGKFTQYAFDTVTPEAVAS